MVFKKLLGTTVKVILPLVLGCWLFWYLYREMDFRQIWEVVRKGVRYEIILLSLVFGLLANVVRGFRWGLLIRSLGERFRMSNIVYAVLGNYAINYILPRVGEVWRCGIVTKYEKISFTKLIGTLLIDRVADMFSVGFIALFIFIFNFGFFRRFLERNPEMVESFQENFSSAWILIALVIVAAAIWFMFTKLSHLTLVQKAKGMFSNIWQGMKSVWLMKQKGLFLIQTVLIWGFYFLYFYITFYAFDFTRDLGMGVGLLAFTMGSIGVAAPVQGGIGAWHFMVISTLVLYGVGESDAAAFALVVHTVQSVWTALCGVFGIAALPIINKDTPEPAADV